MVIAEMIATGDLARLTRPGLELDLQPAGRASRACPSTKASASAMSCCTSRASSSPTCSTRTATTEMRRLDNGAGLAAAVDRRHAVAARRRLRGRAPRGARSLPHVRQRPRLGAAAGGGGAQRPDRGSGGREGAERHAGAHAAHDRSLSARADERFRRPRQPAAPAVDGSRPGRCWPRRCPSDAIIVARSMGAAELLDYPRDKLRGLVLEDGAVTSHVVIVARAMGIPVAGQVKGAVSMAENGDAIIVDGEDGTRASAAAARPRGRLCRKGALPGAPAGALPRTAQQAGRHQGRHRHRPADECRPGRRPAAACRSGRQRHRPVPHRAAVHGRLDLPARRGAGAALPRRARRGARQAGHLPHHRHRRRQGAALFQERHDTRRTRRSAGGRSG